MLFNGLRASEYAAQFFEIASFVIEKGSDVRLKRSTSSKRGLSVY